jgi:hypothetical protein
MDAIMDTWGRAVRLWIRGTIDSQGLSESIFCLAWPLFLTRVALVRSARKLVNCHSVVNIFLRVHAISFSPGEIELHDMTGVSS